MKTILLLFCALGLTIASVAQETPPLSAMERIVHSDHVALETTVRTGTYEGISWQECIEPKPEVDGRTLLSLLYDAQEIPGYALMPNSVTGTHSAVSVRPPGKPSEALRTFSALVEAVGKEGRSVPRGTVTVQVEWMPSVEQARQRLQERRQLMFRTLHADKKIEEQVVSQLPSGRSFGLPMYLDRRFDLRRGVLIQVDRVVVSVQVSDTESVSEDFVEALAWGMIYRLQTFLHPDSSNRQLLNGVRVEPVSRLEKLGCLVSSHRPEVSWSKDAPAPVMNRIFTGKAYSEWTCRVTWGQRWVELEAFSWEMKTWDGKVVKLSRPVFPYRGELIAPLQEVRQALGML